MRKLCIVACLFLGLSTTFAQHYVNPFFDSKGSAGISVSEYIPASNGWNAGRDTIIKTLHRNEDVVWARYVYRIIDMRMKQNYQLYFPATPDDPDYRSLFRVILDAIVDGLPLYVKSSDVGDIKPYFDNEPMPREMVPPILNTDRDGSMGDGNIATSDYMLLNYDSTITDEKQRMRFNNYSYAGFVRNQYKYLIQEVVFFDRHTSRMHSKIIGIAPLQADNVSYYDDMPVMDALYGQILFWIAFDDLRPYMARQFIIPSQNETKRVTFDEFFQKRLYSTYLVGEGNMYNRMLPDSHYGYSAKDIKREQARIEAELLDFEQDLWEY